MKKKSRFIYQGISMLLIIIMVYYGGVALKLWESITLQSHEVSSGKFSEQKKWLAGREKLYRKAAAEANQGLTGIAAAHQLDWGLLAAIDFLLVTTEKFNRDSFIREPDVFESVVYPYFNVHGLAHALRPVLLEEEPYQVLETVYTLKDEYRERREEGGKMPGDEIGNDDPRNPEDLVDPGFYDVQTIERNIACPLKVDTYMGTFTYRYTEKDYSYVAGYNDEGKVAKMIHIEGPVLTDSNYEEDWSRFKEAIIEHAGLVEELVSTGVKARDFVTPEDRRKILEVAQELTHGFNFFESIGHYGHAWPVLEGGRKVSSVFGWRPDPFGGGRREFHTGLDIAPMVKGRPGDILVAAATGKIRARGGYGSPRGFYLEIEDKNGLRYRYFHLDARKPFHQRALTGKIKVGEIIGFMGTSGRSTNVHLHFDVSYDGQVPAILKNVKWIDDDERKGLNRKYIHERYFICPCILLKHVAPDIENSCNSPNPKITSMGISSRKIP
ncbi:MAG: M23 family metallopeptidase [Firmicutes bacterium]|nr:M23 family metallopeptidase [Bacillota bacterium]